MAGRSIATAYKNFLDPLDRALGCITSVRISRLGSKSIELGKDFAVAVAGGDPVALASPDKLFLTVQQTAKIIRASGDKGKFRAHTVKYSYVFAVDASDENPKGQEILAFHWTPDTKIDGEKRFAHLHIKTPMLAKPPLVIPKTFSSAHIPTDRLCIEAIVRFAIEELNVKHQHDDWDGVLMRGERAWREHKTR